MNNEKTLMDLVDNERTDKNTIHAFLELYEELFKISIQILHSNLV